MARRTMTVAAVLAAGLAALLGAGWLFQRSLIYFPSGAVPPVAVVLPGAEEVVLRTGDGLDLAGWWLPADGEEVAAAVVFNGNAGNRADRAPLARRLASRGVSTLLFDYRGYGGNPGRPTEAGLLRDGVAAATFAASQTDAPLVLVGESLGSAVATATALQQPPAALVLRSPFTSLADVGREHYPFLPVGRLLKDRYPVEEQVGRVAAPVLVVASTGDEIVPYRLSERVFAAATGDKELLTLEGLGHNDPALGAGPQLVEAVVRSVSPRPGPP